MWFATFFFIFIEKIKARKKLFIQNEGTISGRRKTEFSKTIIVLTEILTGTHIWVLVLEDWKPSHQSEKNCACFTSLYPLLKKEQDCQYTTQGSRLKCYSISPGYKIYQSFVLYFVSYIFQNKMKIHTFIREILGNRWKRQYKAAHLSTTVSVAIVI